MQTTPAEARAIRAIGQQCGCSQCGRTTQVGMSDCREHGAGVATFKSDFAGHPVTVAYGNDEDEGPYIWRVQIGGVWVSNPEYNFLPSQLDIWSNQTLVDLDRRERMAQEDAAADAAAWA